MKDEHGIRWNQDRTMRAAMTVGLPGNENCLNCHQHNMGGDAYAHNVSAKSLGYKNQRLLHSGAKRGNPDAHIVGMNTAGIDFGFIERCYDEGAAGSFDVMNVHYYAMSQPFEAQNPEGQFERLRALMAEQDRK